jgi:hypothetical protein
MKNMKRFAFAAILGALACSPQLSAQSRDMKITIPFEFHAGDKLLPPGRYDIQEIGSCIVFREADSGNAVLLVQTNGAESLKEHARSLDFRRYGNSYFLNNIWNREPTVGRQYAPTSREKRLAKSLLTPVQTASVDAERVVAGE